MDRDVIDSQLGANGVLFLPYVYGARCPHFDPNAKGAFVGLGPTTTRRDITRSVYESMGHLARDILEVIENTGAPVKELYANGGMSQNDILLQIMSDTTGKTVHALREKDTTGLGGAVVAATAVGIYPTIDDASRQMIHVRRTFIPDKANNEKYARVFRTWQHTYQTMKSVKDSTGGDMKNAEIDVLAQNLAQHSSRIIRT
jgi:xylulokinase